MNPWRAGIVEKSRSIIRFALWIFLAVNSAMLCIFSVFFTYEFLHHLWEWCKRVFFSGNW